MDIFLRSWWRPKQTTTPNECLCTMSVGCWQVISANATSTTALAVLVFSHVVLYMFCCINTCRSCTLLLLYYCIVDWKHVFMFGRKKNSLMRLFSQESLKFSPSDMCYVFFLQASARDKLVPGLSSAYRESDKGFIIIGKYVTQIHKPIIIKPSLCVTHVCVCVSPTHIQHTHIHTETPP